MLRFAPSPTGDMHVGDLRIAIFNYILARQLNEDFIVRVEDTDKAKNIEGKDQEILDILALFGIEYSQVIYQSEHVRFHSAMALQLMHEKKAFSCFCSPQWLDNKREEAKLANKAYSYDDACRNLPAELVIDNTSPFTIRIARPDNASVDSFVIMSQDKTPTQNFACAVDDMLSDISVIIRDEEHRSNTPKQEHIRNSLAYEKKIEYTYLPTLLNAETVSIKWLLEEGFLPEAILNYLVSTVFKAPQEIFTMKESIAFFDLTRITKDSVTFSLDTLKHINKEHLKNLDAKELSRYVGFADEEIGELARIYLDEVQTTKELKSKISPVFTEREIPKELSTQVSTMKACITQAPYFEEYEEFKKYIEENTALKGKDFDMSLRLLLTNAESGPDLSEIYKYLKNYLGEIIK